MKESIWQSLMCTNPANHKRVKWLLHNFGYFIFFKHCFHKIYLNESDLNMERLSLTSDRLKKKHDVVNQQGASWRKADTKWFQSQMTPSPTRRRVQKHLKSFSHLLFDISRWNKVFHSLALWLVINGPTKTQTRLWDMLKLSLCPVKETICLE